MSSNLPQGWEKKDLILLTDKIGSGSTPRGGSKVYLEQGETSLIRSQNIYNLEFSKNGLVFINNEAADKLSNVELKENDVLINITGDSVARVCIVPNEYLPARVNQHVAILRTNKDKLNSKYLQYYLVESKMQNQLLNISSSGATRKALTKIMLEKLSIKYPRDINEQKRIADILSAFDDKIELNNQMNQTLEDMAIALFKESIVDKTHFLDTTLGDMVKIKYGKDHKNLDDGTIPLYGSGGIMRYVNRFLYDKESILIPRKGTLGNLFFIQKPFWTVDTLFYTEINTKKVVPIYLYYLLKRFNLANLNVGSAVPSLTKQALNALELEIPNITMQKKISDILSSYHNKILDNIEQNQTLKKQRDTLLPKLMSGEIRNV